MSGLLITDGMKNRARVNKSVGYVLMPPESFLLLTTPNAAKFRLDEAPSVPSLDQYNKWTHEKEDMMPYLDMDMRTGKVMQHEGRHRALACMVAHVKLMPVAIFLRKSGGLQYYYWDPESGRKRYNTLADMPMELHGQFAPTRIEVKDGWKQESFWDAWNQDIKTTAKVRIKASAPITIGFGWDQYTARVEAAIMLTCMQLQSLRPNNVLSVVLDPAMSEDDKALAIRLLARLNAQVVEGQTPMTFFKYFVQTTDSEYLPPYELVGNAKTFKQVMAPKVLDSKMSNRTNYPNFPEVTTPAPPNTLPQYQVRPPQNQPTQMNLPVWMWNHNG